MAGTSKDFEKNMLRCFGHVVKMSDKIKAKKIYEAIVAVILKAERDLS